MPVSLGLGGRVQRFPFRISQRSLMCSPNGRPRTGGAMPGAGCMMAIAAGGRDAMGKGMVPAVAGKAGAGAGKGAGTFAGDLALGGGACWTGGGVAVPFLGAYGSKDGLLSTGSERHWR